MAQFSRHHKLLPGMKPRPTVNLIGARDTEESIKSEDNATFVFLKRCENYKLTLESKAAKVMCENCRNITIALSEPPISGLMEIYKSHSVVVKLAESCQIPIFQVDDSTDVTIEIGNTSLVKSIYFQRSKDIKVVVSGARSLELIVDTSLQGAEYDVDDIAQWVAYWNNDLSAFVTEKVKRAGIYPSSEQREPQKSNKD